MNLENKCFQIKRGVNNSPTPADNLRLELNPKSFLLLPYHHLELVKFEAGESQDTLTLSFINRTVQITGKHLRDLALALQDRAVAFIRVLSALDRYVVLVGHESSVKTIEIEEKR
jgi:hypothetical protein